MLLDASPNDLGNHFDYKEQETQYDSSTCLFENDNLWHLGNKNPMNMLLIFSNGIKRKIPITLPTLSVVIGAEDRV